MKIIAVIPARYASIRFPGKLMQDLGGKTVILRTYEAAQQSNLFNDGMSKYQKFIKEAHFIFV